MVSFEKYIHKPNEILAVQNTAGTRRMILKALRDGKEYGVRDITNDENGVISFKVDSAEYTVKPSDYLVKSDDSFYSYSKYVLEKLYTRTKCDMVNHPSHYKLKDGLEAIDVIKATLREEEFIGFCKGNALKYQFRAGKKDQEKTIEDYEKAMFYLKEIIK